MADGSALEEGERWAEVLFDFEGSDERRTLTVRAGQVVKVHPREGKSWWPAEHDGNHGFVPATYVNVHPEGWAPTEPAAAATAPAAAPRTAAASSSAAPAPEAEEAQGAPRLQRAVGLFDFEATHANQLSFKKHQELEVEPQATEDWWAAVCEGRTGLVPKNYIRVLTEGSSDANGTADAASATQASPRAPRKISTRRAIARYDFSGDTTRNQLSFTIDQVLEVDVCEGKEWWMARCGNASGLVPCNYIKVLDDDVDVPGEAPEGRKRKASMHARVKRMSTRIEQWEELSRWEKMSGNVPLHHASYFYGYDSLKQLPFFSILFMHPDKSASGGMTQAQYRDIEHQLVFRTYPDTCTVFSEGQVGRAFYIILTGAVTVSKDGAELCTMRQGEWFGEIALLESGQKQRTATATATGGEKGTTLLQLDRNGFNRLVLSMPWIRTAMQELVQHRTGRTLHTIPFFEHLSEHKLNLLGSLFVFQQVKAGACVFQEGERSRKFYVIARGRVQITIKADNRAGGMEERVLNQLKGGDFFGEVALVMNAPRTATVTALEDTTLLVLEATKFTRLRQIVPELEAEFTKQVMLRSAKSLGEISLFKEVGHDKLERLALLFEYTSFDEGDVIFRAGDVGDRFYVLHRGEVEVEVKEKMNSPPIRIILPAGEFFGEIALVEHAPRSATASTLISLSKEGFERFVAIAPEVKNILTTALKTRPHQGHGGRKWIQTSAKQLAGIAEHPPAMFETKEALDALALWGGIGGAMRECLEALEGWPQYLHPPTLDVEAHFRISRKKKFIVSVVGVDANHPEMKAGLDMKVSEVIYSAFERFKKNTGDTIDPAGPSVFGLKVAARSDYLVDPECELGRYKCVTHALLIGDVSGQLRLALVDLRKKRRSGGQETGVRLPSNAIPTTILSKNSSNHAFLRAGGDTHAASLRANALGGGSNKSGSEEITPTLEDVPSKMDAKARFKFEPSGEGAHRQLGFNAGQTLVVEVREGHGWWKATLGDSSGLVPSNYLEIVGPHEDPEKASKEQLNHDGGGGGVDHHGGTDQRGSGLRRQPSSGDASKANGGSSRSLNGASLPGVPSISQEEMARRVKRGIAESEKLASTWERRAQERAKARQQAGGGARAPLQSTEMLWPFRIRLRGLENLRALSGKSAKKFDSVSVRAELVLGGTVLEYKQTVPFTLKRALPSFDNDSIRFDDEWYYFNRLVGGLHHNTRLCFTLAGVKEAKDDDDPKASTSMLHAKRSTTTGGGSKNDDPDTMEELSKKAQLGGCEMQIFDSEFQLKTGVVVLPMWEGRGGERSTLCVDNPNREGAVRISIEMDRFSQDVFYPIPQKVPVRFFSPRIGRPMTMKAGAIAPVKRVNIQSQNSAGTISARDFASASATTLFPGVEALLQRNALETPRMPVGEKNLVQKEAHKLIDRPEVLAKVMFCFDWSDRNQQQRALDLLGQWTPPKPTVAMELLDRTVCDFRVREYAVRCLQQFDDDQFAEYLLQLAQVLKYEPYHESPLARFLLRRALQNPREVGTRLFWVLRSEMHMPQVAARYGLLLQGFLEGCGSHLDELTQQYDVQELLRTVADGAAKLSFESKKERLEYARTELAKLNSQLPETFSMSLDPRYAVSKLVVDKCKVMSSKKRPLWLVFRNTDDVAEPKTVTLMFKSGDDLRQDQMTLQLLRVMEQMWREAGMDLRLSTYGCISTGDELGMLEMVLGSDTTANIQKKYGKLTGAFSEKCIKSWLEENNKGALWHRARDNFVHSCAGYCVATYVMGIGDRHSDNIMVKKTGHLFHIDFGHFLGHFKSKFGFNRERSPFVFTPEMAYVMGGKGDKPFNDFVELCGKAFNVLRGRGNELINLFRLMIPAGMPELVDEDDIQYMVDKLCLEMTEEEASKKFKAEIFSSFNDRYRRIDNFIHNQKV